MISRAGSPQCLCAVQQAWDGFRLATCYFLWRLTVGNIEPLINALLPEDFLVYASPLPFVNPGKGVQLGICVVVEGATQTKPEHFICNVGHIPTVGDAFANG